MACSSKQAYPLSRSPLILAAAIAAMLATAPLAAAQESAVVIPPPSLDEKVAGTTEIAVFAGGCFWGVQGVFQHVKGVRKAVSGYSGGTAATADYETVSGGKTGHAESVEVTYDPREVTYGQLLQVFFSVAHNPTQLNYQGPDHGTQYRSAIFAVTDEQKHIADAYIAELGKSGAYPATIVTQVSPFEGFYAAEDYHQDFLTRNPTHPYIVYNDLPKIENLRALFPQAFRANPVLVFKAKS
ncbi:MULTISPECIES: peptide-methionine (S)-S-oxide reductase MsrA [unclassified Ensifer]|uniref:peptide-methionine (S)-S-oxide reductase MsrA n=1 Tax=unclassified Ensifer TaxID=2633371 RepID=UPI000812F3E1|nr:MULTISPECIES: peptide-methionine (S)-S-oxide reductase MsrA [unclassified Ensifer]OCP02544.1 peptide-methionine (S)-S-oxide reductase [Ensifer sp. LC14]OCP09305.1 peptide-methionine (S)-S-oxide reductase [Ensifer sp. LC13]OCP10485.1 peptide-methionine (S)-S-oxide reductase [Ensifer sp. LC11]OCP32553.1 peptide-methionine (S)-S-oxide reductase [Ensifer sp. LC499]